MTTASDTRTLTIVVAAPSESGHGVRQVVSDWARAEMIRGLYWVNPQESATGEVEAQRLEAEGPSSVTLPEDIGRIAWERCTLLVVQPLSPDDRGDPAVVQFADRFSQFLERSVLVMGTPMMRINLLVPSTDLVPESVDPAVLIDGWEQTIVASPEERASPDHPNVLVLGDRNLVSHAAIALCSSGGLWVGMDDTSPLLDFVAESGSGDAAPRVVRSFVRSVRGGEVTPAVAEYALSQQDGRWRVPAAAEPLGATSEPEAVIEDTVRVLDRIDQGALVYAAPPALVVVQKTKVGFSVIWADFKEFWRIQLRRITDIPARITAAAEDRITRKMFGPDGAQVFGFGTPSFQDRSAQLVELREEDGDTGLILGQAKTAERALQVLGRAARPEAARAQAWLELRQVCLGMVDGGALPVEVPKPVAGNVRQVITEPEKVVPDSEAPRFEVPGDVIAADDLLKPYRGLVLPPCDPLLTARLDRDLDLVRTKYDERAQQEATQAQAKEGEAAAAREQAAQATASGQDPAVFTSVAARADGEAQEARGREGRARQWAERLHEVEDDLVAWAQPRLPTLMWRVGETIGSQLDDATNDQEAALAAIHDAPGLDVDGIERARKRLARSLVLWFLLAAVGGGLLFGLAGVTLAPVLAVVVFLVMAFGSFARYSRTKSMCEAQFAAAVADQINAMNRLAHAAREVSRLAVLYKLYVEWSEILGYQAHAPWTPDEESMSTTPIYEVDRKALPPALVVGSSEAAEDAVATVGASAARSVQQQGWLTSSYQGNRNFAMERLAQREGRAADDLDPDRDADTSPTGARPYFLDELRAHRPQKAAFREAYKDIAEYCSTLSPDLLFKQVEVEAGVAEDITDFLAGLVPQSGAQLPGFPVELLSSDAQVRMVYEHPEPLVWAPMGIGDGTTVRHRPVPTTRSGQYLLQTVRIDIGRPLDPKDLAMFRWTTVNQRSTTDSGSEMDW